MTHTDNEFPDRLYEAPETWGDVYGLFDGDTGARFVREWQETFRDDDTMGEITLDECTQFDLERVLPSGNALYFGGWHHDGYHRNMRRWIVTIGPCSSDGLYPHLREDESIEDAVEWDNLDHEPV